MFILIALAIATIFSLSEDKKYSLVKDRQISYKTLSSEIFFLTLLILFVWRFIFNYEHFIILDGYGCKEYFFFTLIALSVAVSYYYLRAFWVNHTLISKGDEYPKHRTFKYFLIVCFALALLLWTMTEWYRDSYSAVNVDSLLITFLSPASGTDTTDIFLAMESPILFALFFICLFARLLFINLNICFKDNKLKRDIAKQHRYLLTCGTVIAGLLFFYAFFNAYKAFKLNDLYQIYCVRSNFLAEHYHDPHEKNFKFPTDKRNLIILYLESYENSYMSPKDGGFMQEDLCPELTALAKENINFSHNELLGGPRPAFGTTWSIASMINMTMGIPMKLPLHPSAYWHDDEYLPGVYGLGDILAKAGYRQEFMIGSDSSFSNLKALFKCHGNFKIFDHPYALEQALLPPDYHVFWGFEDRKLFEFAKMELTALSQSGQPFSFVMETADTHRPGGYLEAGAEQKYAHHYANVIRESSKEAAAFIAWLQEQDFYPATTVLIVGDHLSMESDFFHFYAFDKRTYRRSQYNVFLNPAPSLTYDQKVFTNRDYANYDFFPTILSAMGVEYEGEQLGLGTDLFSGAPTLFERYGFKAAEKELKRRSDFYYETFYQRQN